MKITPIQKDISGCAIVGIMYEAGTLFSGKMIIDAITNMHDRSNGLGGGFAAYGIYPEYKDQYAFHLMFDNPSAKDITRNFLEEKYIIKSEESIPTRTTKAINQSPILHRYFLEPKPKYKENDRPFPIYWDKMLLNASQVTNPSVDPLREPMEMTTFIGRKPDKLKLKNLNNPEETISDFEPQLKLDVPIMFSAMSYGSISYNACLALARAAKEAGTFANSGEEGLHKDFHQFGSNMIVQGCFW